MKATYRGRHSVGRKRAPRSARSPGSRSGGRSRGSSARAGVRAGLREGRAGGRGPHRGEGERGGAAFETLERFGDQQLGRAVHCLGDANEVIQARRRSTTRPLSESSSCAGTAQPRPFSLRAAAGDRRLVDRPRRRRRARGRGPRMRRRSTGGAYSRYRSMTISSWRMTSVAPASWRAAVTGSPAG
jgi:hypothetical protein